MSRSLSSFTKELDAAKSGKYFRVIPIDLGQLQKQLGFHGCQPQELEPTRSRPHCGLHLLCAFLPTQEPADLGKEADEASASASSSLSSSSSSAVAALKLIRWKTNDGEKDGEFLVKAHLVPAKSENDIIFISKVTLIYPFQCILGPNLIGYNVGKSFPKKMSLCRNKWDPKKP